MKMWKAINKIGDSFIKWLLRSRYHRLLSKTALLITVTGHKSGKRYTLPVEYGRKENTVIIFSRPNRTWWRNIRGITPVMVTIEGQNFSGGAELLTDPESVEHEIRRVYPTRSGGKIEWFYRGWVVIRIRLEHSSPEVTALIDQV
jgi:hypothetical protein